jgi:hypothetical protein
MGAKISVTTTVYGGTQYLWALRTEIALCHPSGAKNFEVSPKYMENLCTLV